MRRQSRLAWGKGTKLPTAQELIRKRIALAQRRLRDNHDLTHSERAIAIRLLTFVQTEPGHARYGKAWPSAFILAKLEGCHEKTIQRAVAKLKGTFFEVTYTSYYGGNHKAFFTPIWTALMGIVEQPEAPAAPIQEAEAAVRPDAELRLKEDIPTEAECSPKEDISAVEKGHFVPYLLSSSTPSSSKRELPLPSSSEEGPFAFIDNLTGELEFKEISDLTWDETELAIKRFDKARGTGKRAPERYQKMALKHHHATLHAGTLMEAAIEQDRREAAANQKQKEAQQQGTEATAETLPSPSAPNQLEKPAMGIVAGTDRDLRKARWAMEAVLKAKYTRLHHKLRGGGLNDQLDGWVRMEAEKPGSGLEDMSRCDDELRQEFRAATKARFRGAA